MRLLWPLAVLMGCGVRAADPEPPSDEAIIQVSAQLQRLIHDDPKDPVAVWAAAESTFERSVEPQLRRAGAPAVIELEYAFGRVRAAIDEGDYEDLSQALSDRYSEAVLGSLVGAAVAGR